MPAPVVILGIGADGPAGLRPTSLDLIEQADFLAGGTRHLAFFPRARGERFTIGSNLDELAAELHRRPDGQRCVVLASGDPLFYGIGKFLAERLGPHAVRVEPAVSSMQLAFARAGVAWQDAALASVHGRDLRATLLPLLGRPVIGLFTADGDGPAAVARFLLDRGLDDYGAVVGESLGASDERVTRWPSPAELAAQSFAPLNYLVLVRRRSPAYFAELAARRALVPGAPDESFVRPADAPEVMTRREARAVILSRLAGPADPGDTFWDVGAGLGTVAVELAVLRPGAEVVAVEKDAARANYLRQNRELFGAYNVRPVRGEAPEALAAESQRPRRVFLGGSGGRLGDVLDLAADRLTPGGRLVASFVTLENLALAMQRLRTLVWPTEVTEVHVARGDDLAGLTGLKPQRGVFIVSADKP